jgi:hypothetical protein
MRFGQPSRARAAFSAGLELAERHQLNAWYFRIEEALKQIMDGVQQQAPTPVADLSEAPAIREMEMGLREFALSPE